MAGDELRWGDEIHWPTSSGFLPLNTNAVINIWNLNYINSFILYASMTKLSNDKRYSYGGGEFVSNCMYIRHFII